ncbi:hypothetical protein E1B28_011190 [Marasmius oreades]|uniref:Uncharacterized protein n=1 Tax=Marasmius oreades TaxID=181124 RepID=A0A9P7RTJ9_9AGAR|nr:uncharacterized protein E1B28_011190 [Marasmius oreades]KAG7089514.1 hypothetical protein E1B28_011190 [Marasmius oreades]
MSQRQQQQQLSQSSSASQIAFPTSRQSIDRRSPVPEAEEAAEEMTSQSQSPVISPGVSPNPSPVRVKFQDRPTQMQADVIEEPSRDAKSSPQLTARPKAVRAETLDPSTYRNAEPVSSDDILFPSRTHGRDHTTEGLGTFLTHKPGASIDCGRPNKLERSDTGASNGSIVAAMRNRYSYSPETPSPPHTKDIPRIPQSVSNLASKYDRPVSPPSARPLPSIDTASRQSRETAYRERERETTVTTNHRSTSNPVSAVAGDDEFTARRRHQQRMEQMVEMEFREKEQELRRREQDIEQRAKELAQARANLLQTVSSLDIAKPRQRQLSFQQGQSGQTYSTNGDTVAFPVPASPRLGATAPMRPHSQYSTSATHLVPPASPRGPYRNRGEECSRDPSATSTTSTSMNSSPVMSTPRTEKKGWMRRLSMPIVAGNAFLEGKKHSSHNSFGGGKGGSISLDSKRNASNTYLRGGIAGEDGRLSGGMTGVKNYELGSGISNISVTNLNSRR